MQRFVLFLFMALNEFAYVSLLRALERRGKVSRILLVIN